MARAAACQSASFCVRRAHLPVPLQHFGEQRLQKEGIGLVGQRLPDSHLRRFRAGRLLTKKNKALSAARQGL